MKIKAEEINNGHVWCIRHGVKQGFWLSREACRNIQEKGIRCPKKCKERGK